jgi:hypothetical protein
MTMIKPAVDPLSLDNFDPFAPEALRLTADYESVGVKKILTTVPVRKPNKQDFVRVRSEPEFRIECGLIQIGVDNEFYVVAPALAPELVGEYVLHTIYTAINRQGTLFLWPVRLPDRHGKTSPWARSAHEAAGAAYGESRPRGLRYTPGRWNADRARMAGTQLPRPASHGFSEPDDRSRRPRCDQATSRPCLDNKPMSLCRSITARATRARGGTRFPHVTG